MNATVIALAGFLLSLPQIEPLQPVPDPNRAARRRAMKRLGCFADRVKRSVW